MTTWHESTSNEIINGLTHSSASGARRVYFLIKQTLILNLIILVNSFLSAPLSTRRGIAYHLAHVN